MSSNLLDLTLASPLCRLHSTILSDLSNKRVYVLDHISQSMGIYIQPKLHGLRSQSLWITKITFLSHRYRE